MKKLFALLFALIVSAPASAEWFVAGESENGNRLLGKIGSLKIDNPRGIWTAMGVFAWAVNGQPSDHILVAIPVDSCDNGGGQMVLRDHRGKITQRWWAENGRKMYDQAGIVLCESVRQAIEDMKNEQGERIL